MNDMPDEELMARFQAGNVAAFELLFEKYRGPVFSFLCRMLDGQREAAEDLMQEIFMKLLNARDLYEPRARFSTWLFAIARNHCLNHLRSRRYAQAQHTVSLNAAEHGQDDVPAPPRGAGAAPDTGLRRAEVAARMEEAVRALPDAYREVFLLRAVEGHSHNQTAQILGMNPATVRIQYHRARLMLRKELGRMPGWEGIVDEL